MAEKEEFFDEKILEYRRRARNEKYKSLETGMYIRNELVRFERREVIQKKMSIMLPESFVKMPSNLAKIKYASEQRPQVIWTSLDTTVNLGVSMSNAEISTEMISILSNQTKMALKRLNPSFIFYEGGTEMKGVPLGWFEFKSYGLDSDVYNLMFLAQVGGRMVHGIFNCSYQDTLEWRDAARQMMYSVNDMTHEEKKDERTKSYSGTI